MTLSIAPNLQIAEHSCPDCGRPFRRITGFVLRLAPAAVSFEAAPLFGRKLPVAEAERHPRLEDFRELVEHVLGNDALVAQHAATQPQH